MRIRVQKMPLNVEKLLIMLAISKKMRTFAVVFDRRGFARVKYIFCVEHYR